MLLPLLSYTLLAVTGGRPGNDARTQGQGLVEYALLLILVAVIMVALLVVLGPGLQNIYRNIVMVL
jgi:pilus assembly protein Flp/PilA